MEMYFSDQGFFCSISFKILPKEDGVGEATKSRPNLVEKSYYVVGYIILRLEDKKIN